MRVTVPNMDSLPDAVRRAFDAVTSRINTVFAKQHNGDGTHSTIIATGTISERGRTVPQGEWINVPYLATDYTGSGGMTWGVDAADMLEFAYMLIGKTMFVQGLWNNTSVTAPLGIALSVKIPGGFISKRRAQWSNQMTDSGTIVSSQNRVEAGSTTLDIRRQDNGNLTAAVNTTVVKFQGFFEVQ